MEQKTKAYGYARVSTDMQVDGASREVQFQAIRKVAAENNLDLQEIFWEPGVSAKTANRPVLKEMLAKLSARGCDVKALVVYDMSRLSRDTMSFFTDIAPALKKGGVQVYSSKENFDETPEGKFMMTLNIAVAQLDNDKKSARVSENMSETAMQGWNITIPPLGFRSERQYVVDEVFDDNPRRKKHSILVPDTEQNRAELVKRVLLRFSEGDMTPAQLAAYAQKIGLRTKKGKVLSLNSIIKTLRHPAYAGFNQSDTLTGGKRVRARWDGFIDEMTYDRNLALLDNNGKKASNFRQGYNKKDEKYPLKGSIYCWQCGRPLRGSAPKNGSGEPSPRYHCAYCRGIPSVPIDELHDDFGKMLETITPDSGTLKLTGEVLRRVLRSVVDTAKKDIKLNNARMEEIEQLDAQAVEKVISGVISQSDRILMEENHRKEIQQLMLDNERLEKQLGISENGVMRIIEFMGKPATIWATGGYDRRQLLQRMIFPDGIRVNLREKKCGTEKISPLYSVIASKNASKGGENDEVVISAGVEPALTG